MPKEKKIVVNCAFEQWGNHVKRINVGDDINYDIFRELSGKAIFNYDEFYHGVIDNIMGIGSIIEWKANKKSIIWGSGIMEKEKDLRNINPQKILAVRGVHTRDHLIENGIMCPPVYGDPALLLPLIYKPINIVKTNKIGLIPHFVDLNNPIVLNVINSNKNIELINIKDYKNWHHFVDKIVSCRYIISSSLHGLIISDAYGIPNVWVKYSNKLLGGEFKFRDYFSSVGRNDVVISAFKCLDLTEVEAKVSAYRKVCFDYSQLLEVCPFVIKDKYKRFGNNENTLV